MLQRTIILLALAVTLALPFLLRPARPTPTQADATLVIITPHNEAIRHEFGVAFTRWYEERTGQRVFIDWRVIGGTSEIARFLEGEYTAAFRHHWTRQLGRRWSNEVQSGFHRPRLTAADSPAVHEARAAFLASSVSCGIDLFFGGGTYDFVRQAQAGRLLDSGILQRHPEWFTEDIIPREFAGEEYYDKDGLWVGTVLSSYGMIYNHDALARVGLDEPPQHWDDLADPRLVGQVAIADPTKSGSIAKAFENIIQQQMQRRLTALQAEFPGGDPGEIERQAVEEGWLDGMRLLQLAGANARYFTDTAQKPPIDVAAGNCAVGLCIDFYGRQQVEAVVRRGSSDRVGYVAPPGGSVSSVDPVGMLRGAPNEEVAKHFIDYVMSMEGQRLWNYAPGTLGGPERFALRRLPVRRDFYVPEHRQFQTDPEDAPYTAEEQLIYRAAWTGRLFREMSLIVRIMCFDTHRELVAAWREIIAAGMPPEALAVLQDLSAVDYAAANGVVRDTLAARNKVEEVRFTNQLGRHFRAQYRRAAEIARASR